MRRDSKSARGEDMNIGFWKLPEYRGSNGVGGGVVRGDGGREVEVEVVGKGGGRDGGGERSGFHFERRRELWARFSAPNRMEKRNYIYTTKLPNYMEMLQL